MKTGEIFIEIDHFQKNKSGNWVCGDSFMCQKLKGEGRIICVLSDGLGSGIKASVLSTLTATLAMNYTAMNENILRTARCIIETLPEDTNKKISYSTFCIIDMDCFGHAKIIEYESPSFYLIRDRKVCEIPKQKVSIDRNDIQDTFLFISEITLQKEDRLVCFSDGVNQSGMGSSHLPEGWGINAGPYICEIIRQNPEISAKELSRKIVIQAEKNDGYQLKDDTSCCVAYVRTPRNLLICTGPPYDAKNDKYLAGRVQEFSGKKIICGGTTASIIARELHLSLQAGDKTREQSLPPVSHMESIDLVTEGILTLSQVERLLSNETSSIPVHGNAAEQIVRMLQNSDKIKFLVGTCINVAHQDPNLPVELEIRRNVVKKIKFLLETKWLKDVEIIYL